MIHNFQVSFLLVTIQPNHQWLVIWHSILWHSKQNLAYFNLPGTQSYLSKLMSSLQQFLPLINWCGNGTFPCRDILLKITETSLIPWLLMQERLLPQMSFIRSEMHTVICNHCACKLYAYFVHESTETELEYLEFATSILFAYANIHIIYLTAVISCIN